MNTPYQWTKQVASHFGGTRDGLVVHWPAGIAARGEVRHQFHHVIDVLPTVLDAAGLPQPETVEGVPQQPVEGTSMRYCFDDADGRGRGAPRSTSRWSATAAIYHEGWTAVTRHGTPWLMVDEPRPPSTTTCGSSTTSRTDWSQAHDLADERPRAARASCRSCSSTRRPRAPRLPARRPRHRAREPRSSPVATTCTHGRRRAARPAHRSAHRGGGAERQEPLAPHHGRARHPGRPRAAVDQRRARRAGRSVRRLVAVRASTAVPHYAYNRYGKDLTVVRADSVPVAGRARGGAGLRVRRRAARRAAATATMLHRRARGRARGIAATTAYYFAFDETFNVGIDRGSPVVDDYPAVHNAFDGTIASVRFDLSHEVELGPEVRRRMTTLVND